MATTDSIVEYREIPGFPGYRVGDDSSVWTQWMRRYRKGFGRGVEYVIVPDAWFPMKPTRMPSGYYSIQIRSNGKPCHQLIHRLVLIAFVGAQPVGQECRHLDGNQSNNRLFNLCWGTKESNYSDRVRHGTHLRGETNRLAKLTDEQAMEIIRLSVEGAGRKELAERFGVDRGTIGKIAVGRAYKSAWEKLYGERASSIYSRCMRKTGRRFAKVDICGLA